MRVIEIISGLGLGGAEKALAKRLEFAPPDVETHVIVTGRQNSVLSTRMSQRANLHCNVSSVPRLVHALRADLILTHNPREAVRVLTHPTLPSRYPVVVVAHNEITSEYKSKRKILDAVLPLINSRARMHLAVSTRAAQGLQSRGSRDVRVNLLGSTFDTSCEPDRRYWPLQTMHRVLVLGRMSPQKNLMSLVEAVALVQNRLRESQTHVVLAGDGELKEVLAKEIGSRGLKDLVSCVGWINKIDSILAGADTLLVPSIAEGGPMVLYEALLAGIRVTSTPVGASEDVLRNDSFLRVLPDATCQSLASGLNLIAQDPALLPNEVASRRLTHQNLQADSCAHSFYAFCQEAVL